MGVIMITSTEYSLAVADEKLTFPQECLYAQFYRQPEHGCELLHFGLPAADAHETACEKKNRLSAQCIEETRNRLIVGS